MALAATTILSADGSTSPPNLQPPAFRSAGLTAVALQLVNRTRGPPCAIFRGLPCAISRGPPRAISKMRFSFAHPSHVPLRPYRPCAVFTCHLLVNRRELRRPQPRLPCLAGVSTGPSSPTSLLRDPLLLPFPLPRHPHRGLSAAVGKLLAAVLLLSIVGCSSLVGLRCPALPMQQCLRLRKYCASLFSMHTSLRVFDS